ncbi:hypothetical protein ACJX0J_025273, partial [Zea mays]
GRNFFLHFVALGCMEDEDGDVDLKSKNLMLGTTAVDIQGARAVDVAPDAMDNNIDEMGVAMPDNNEETTEEAPAGGADVAGSDNVAVPTDAVVVTQEVAKRDEEKDMRDENIDDIDGGVSSAFSMQAFRGA